MNRIFCIAAVLAAMGTAAWGQATMAPQNVRTVEMRGVTQENAARLANLHQALQPSARSWVVEQGKAASRRTSDLGSLRAGVQQRFANSGQSLKGADIDAMVALVLMEAQKDAETDLRDAMNEMEKVNKAKQALRDLSQKLKQEAASNRQNPSARCVTAFCRELGGQLQQVAAMTAQTKHPVRWMAPEAITYAQLETLADQAGKDADSLSDLSQQDQLQLQRAMDQKSQLEQMLSNIMKAASDTQNSIVSNLK